MAYYKPDRLLEIKMSVDMLAVAADLGLNPRSDRRKSRLPLIDCPSCAALAYIVTVSHYGYPLWGCFSCRRRGDVLRMVQMSLRLPPHRFPEVIAWLKKKGYL